MNGLILLWTFASSVLALTRFPAQSTVTTCQHYFELCVCVSAQPVACDGVGLMQPNRAGKIIQIASGWNKIMRTSTRRADDPPHFGRHKNREEPIQLQNYHNDFHFKLTRDQVFCLLGEQQVTSCLLSHFTSEVPIFL